MTYAAKYSEEVLNVIVPLLHLSHEVHAIFPDQDSVVGGLVVPMTTYVCLLTRMEHAASILVCSSWRNTLFMQCTVYPVPQELLADVLTRPHNDGIGLEGSADGSQCAPVLLDVQVLEHAIMRGGDKWEGGGGARDDRVFGEAWQEWIKGLV